MGGAAGPFGVSMLLSNGWRPSRAAEGGVG